MLNIFKGVIAINKYIIQVRKVKVIKVILQSVINITLKTVQAITYTKGHNSIFKLAEARYEYGLLFITFSYLKAVKSGDNIKLSVQLSLAKPLKNLIYERYWVSIFNRNSVKSFIINVELNISFYFFSEKDRGGY